MPKKAHQEQHESHPKTLEDDDKLLYLLLPSAGYRKGFDDDWDGVVLFGGGEPMMDKKVNQTKIIAKTDQAIKLS